MISTYIPTTLPLWSRLMRDCRGFMRDLWLAIKPLGKS